ncbi:MAG: FtsX-like permease family protein [Pseudomonadota bacterium]
MIGFLLRASRRHLRAHPWQALLAVLGVSLGVAVVTAIDLTRVSATRAFQDATRTITGAATHQVLGGPQGIDEVTYVRLRQQGLGVHLAPVIEATVTLSDHETSLRLLGVDVVAESGLRGATWSPTGRLDEELARLMVDPGSALVSSAAAQRLGIAEGDSLALIETGGDRRLGVIGVLSGAADAPALRSTELILVDIATAQELLGMVGRLSRIDVVAPTQQAVDRLESRLPPDLILVQTENRTAAVEGLTRAFYTNLQALSLMALLVGMFLIYNSEAFMVVQRRSQFGMLRAVGTGRGQLVRLVLAEAALLGSLGSILGLLLGYLLSAALLELVARTLNDLYFDLPVTRVHPDVTTLVKGTLLGLGGSLVAAVLPAVEAGSVAPAAALRRVDLETRAALAATRLLWVALGLLAMGGLVLWALPGSLVFGFTGLFMVILAGALASPAVTLGVVRGLEWFAGRECRLALRLVLQGAASSLSRTGVAVAALMLAVATTIGVGVMVDSFRASVDRWLGQTLRADYYLSPGGQGAIEAAPVVDRAFAEGLVEWPGIAAVSHVRRVTLPTPEGSVALAAFQLNDSARKGFEFIAGQSTPAVWRRFEGEPVVLVTEAFAYHRRVRPGDRIELRTDAGLRSFEIIAVYRDYGSDRGTVAMSRTTYDRHWNDPGVLGIGLYTDLEFDPAVMRNRLDRVLGVGRHLEMVSNREIREASLAVFDRTFTITEVLRALAGVIAFVGVFSALMALQLERGRYLGILKAVGVMPYQIRWMILGETALVGAIAGAIALVVGMALAVLLIQVINRRSFGWSMVLQVDPAILAGGVLLALGAALLAGVYPAIRMAATHPAVALRSE